MKEMTNFQKLDYLYNRNHGYITREEVKKMGIATWFLSDFTKKKKLNKVASGIYASDSYIVDEYYLFQKRYPKYVFYGISALYLLKLTDTIPTNIEVVGRQNYNPIRNKDNSIKIKKISNNNIFTLGICKTKTIYGNTVNVYDQERMICEIIKYRDKYEGETFIKAIKMYINRYNNQTKLFDYAKKLGIEKKVFEIMEIFTNEIK